MIKQSVKYIILAQHKIYNVAQMCVISLSSHFQQPNLKDKGKIKATNRPPPPSIAQITQFNQSNKSSSKPIEVPAEEARAAAEAMR